MAKLNYPSTEKPRGLGFKPRTEPELSTRSLTLPVHYTAHPMNYLVTGGLSGKCRALLLAGEAGGIAAVFVAETGDKP